MDSPPDGEILSSAVTEVLKKRMFIRVAATIQDYVKKYKDANDIPDNVKREEHWRQVFTKTMEMELCEYLTTCCRMSHGLNTTQLQELAYKFAVSNNLKNFPKNWTEKKSITRLGHRVPEKQSSFFNP